ncbi:hypothetical protein V8B55DRAFT_1552698 [Mucor lusitanicus]|uniref:F-box domain-containing protein n=2 Tax=Mucor circinelloides f. lusitanicus TaxID=29924 RepID=A0A162R0U9_MUCCL|nr:hypothetical protein FB192DRAFT_1398380 [Mucor lusitanicus]OAD07220.1 hypothetical protein MUCCIDRAFT_107822 [Mucor lusitanicus CBS 277.49]
MYSNLPREVLEQIFTHPDISKRDLLQLQLTCKQWSNVAQKHLYKEISLIDSNLYTTHQSNPPAIRKRLALWMRTLLLLNQSVGKFVKTISVDESFNKAASEDSLLNIGIFAHLCPNIVEIKGLVYSSELLKTLTSLHRQGKLQHLEDFPTPNRGTEDADILDTNYYTSAMEFKDTLKNMYIREGIRKARSPQCLITPASLQLFPSLKCLILAESSRVNLYQLRDYLSGCPSTLETLIIRMSGSTLPPSTVNGDQSAVHPRKNIRHLQLDLDSFLVSDEMAFTMRMFASLDKFDFIPPYREDVVSHQYDMQVVAQFLKYLSLVPLVEYSIGFGTAQSVASISRLVIPMDIKSLSLHASVPEPNTVLRLLSKSSFMKAPLNSIAKTNRFDIDIRVDANEAQALLDSVLENLKGRTMDSLSIDSFVDSFDIPQKLTQQSIDSLLNINVQLVFNLAEFPPHVPLSQTRKLKHLAYLRLANCKITESYFTWLSCQFEQIDNFEFSNYYRLERNTDIKIRIPLLYTTLDKLSLTITGHVMSFIIRVWVNCRCITLKANVSRLESYTLEEYEETGSLVDGYEVIVYCAGLKEIHCKNAVYKLP